MMGRATRLLFATSVAPLLAIALGASSASADPLVTGNLIIYYNYDEIDSNQFLDGSGNGFHGTIFEGDPMVDATPGTLTLETTNVARGTGAALFQQSFTSTDRPVYIDSHGEDITANFPDLLPTSGIDGADGYSFSLWANLEDTGTLGLPGGGSQSLWATRNSNGGFQTHVQKEASGALRMTFRTNGPCCTDIVNATRFTDGSADNPNGDATVPYDEWFHFAGTYDQPSNMWAMYYNGQQISTGSGSGEDDGILGDWGGQKFLGDFLAAGSGTVTEARSRLVQGLMDELYLFNRALTAEEVMTLYTGVVGGLDGDYNGDGSVDAADYTVWRDGGSSDSSQAGYELWRDNFGNTSSGSVAAAAVPEPSSIVAAFCCCLGTLAARRHMKTA